MARIYVLPWWLSLAATICFFYSLIASTSAIPTVDDPFNLLLPRQSAATEQYPGPNTTGASWTRGYAHAKHLLSQMTLEEKVNITSGVPGPCVGQTGAVPRLNISSLCLEDSPVGVRPVDRVTQFPSEVATAATWSRNLTSLRAKYLAYEFKTMGVNIWLGPVASGPLGRSVYDGRNWEGWSPDQYLNGELTALTVTHAQENGLMTCVKHFIGYEQETFRDPYNSSESYMVFPINEQNPISSNIDDRTSHEVYLWSFANAVRVGAATIMCSYNELNQTHACGDDATLNRLLKDELNFAGAVISDWGGTWADTDYNGGLDVTMPGSGSNGSNGLFGGQGLIENVQNGTISESRIDDAVLRILTPYFELQGTDNSYPDPGFNANDLGVPSRGARRPEHALVMADLVAESFTLVKNIRTSNQSRGLPLKNKDELLSLAVLGQDAGPNPTGMTSCSTFGSCNTPDYGALSMGGGSGWAIPSYLIDPLSAIQRYARLGRFNVNLDITSNATSSAFQASQSESAVVFVSALASEGMDRQNLTLFFGGDELIEAVAAVNNDTIIIIHSSGPVLMPWSDHPNITAIAYAYYPGQEMGTPIPGLLFGEINPSGKLPFVIGKNESDYLPNSIISDKVKAPQSNFTDGLFVDYKWFSYTNTTPLYPFGHGLSYTTFDYATLVLKESYKVDQDSVNPTKEKWDTSMGRETFSLYDKLLNAYIDITNTGNVFGKEVAQLYIQFPTSANEPLKALRGFKKVSFDPGETKRLEFELSRKDVSYWSTEEQQWKIAKGEYTFHVGASSMDIRSNTTWSF